MDKVIEALRNGNARLIASGRDREGEIRHFLLPDGNVAEIVLPLN